MEKYKEIVERFASLVNIAQTEKQKNTPGFNYRDYYYHSCVPREKAIYPNDFGRYVSGVIAFFSFADFETRKELLNMWLMAYKPK